MANIKIHDEQKEQMIGAFAAGADVALAAKIVGVNRSTVYALANRDPEFSERMDEARALADEKVIRSLFEMATVGKNITAMIFWLKNRQPGVWRDRHDLKVEKNDDREFLDIRLEDGGQLHGAVGGAPALGTADPPPASLTAIPEAGVDGGDD